MRQPLFFACAAGVIALIAAACGGSVVSDCPPGGCADSGTDSGTCTNGQTKPAGDGCNTCTCMNGTWGCTLMACVDSGPPVDPGNVPCAGGPCAVPGNYCCDTPTLDGGVEKCVPDSTSA